MTTVSTHAQDRPTRPGYRRRTTRREFIKNIGMSAAVVAAGGMIVSQAGCSKTATDERSNMATKTQVKNALKERISFDDPGNFNQDNWDKVRLGIYYDEEDELVDIVVYETTAALANKEGRYLPDEVWRSLIAKIGPSNTPEEAVDPMMDATLRAVLLPPGNEGPPVHGPKKRPTLRSARKA